MIKKKNNKRTDIADTNFKKLSIQVSLNGLSFCVADTVSQQVVQADTLRFQEECLPEKLVHHLKALFQKYRIDEMKFDEVSVIHRNTLFGLVPKPLFDPNALSDYLKFNTKLFANDTLAFDEFDHEDLVNVYVPYTNVNNYIYELFGEFTFFHDATIIISTLLNNADNKENPICYVHVSDTQLDICILDGKKLLLYNSFPYETKEDFTYYVLFVLEQMELEVSTVHVKFFGAIEEDDPRYVMCLNYMNNGVIFIPSGQRYMTFLPTNEARIDFTVLNSL